MFSVHARKLTRGCGQCTVLWTYYKSYSRHTLGIKERPAIKTKHAGRQSRKLACNVIWGCRLRGYLRVMFIKYNLLACCRSGYSSWWSTFAEGLEDFWVGVWIYRAASATLKPDDEKYGQFVLSSEGLVVERELHLVAWSIFDFFCAYKLVYCYSKFSMLFVAYMLNDCLEKDIC